MLILCIKTNCILKNAITGKKIVLNMLMIFINHFLKDKTFIMCFFIKKKRGKRKKKSYKNIKHFRHPFAFNTYVK